MSDTPFGFGPFDREEGGRMPGGAGGSGGFDVNALGQMLTQLGQMLSQASSSSGPVNYDLAQQMAMQQLGAAGTAPVADEQRRAVEEAVHLAELWLEDATTLPSGVRAVAAWSPQDWITQTMPTWKRLCDPVAQRVSGAWVAGMPAEAREIAGPMLGMVSQVGGLAFGSQLGSGLGQLAADVLTSTDVGLPLGPEGTAALLPAAVQGFTDGLERPSSEVMVFLAAREVAHHRLFGHVPWLRQRLMATVEEFASGISVDTSKIEELARDLDPNNPGAIEEAMRSGLFEPQTSPGQEAALRRLETLLALVEGWVDVVVAAAVGERLPGAEPLRETLRRRRASGGPAEQTFATLVGLELRPRQLRAAAELWRRLGDQRGISGRDAVWDHPDLVPTADDLDDPDVFLSRSTGSDASDASDDPMAALEALAEREKAEGSAGGSAGGSAEGGSVADGGPPDGGDGAPGSGSPNRS